MKIIFSKHAEENLKVRKIDMTEVMEVIKFPDKITKRKGKHIFTKTAHRGTIEIVAERTERYLRIVTLYWL